MRNAIVVLVVMLGILGTATAQPAPGPRPGREVVAVVELEQVGNGAPTLDRMAKDATRALRDWVVVHPRFRLALNSDRWLIDGQLPNNCEGHYGCMSYIAQKLQADVLVHGKLEVKRNQIIVTLKLQQISSRRSSVWSSSIPYRGSTPRALADLVSGGMARLVRTM